MAFVVVKDRAGAVVQRLPRNTDDVDTHLTSAQADALVTAIEGAGMFPADGGKEALGITYPSGDYTSQLPLDTGYTVAAVTGDSWD